jgi:hypothetical protein
VPPHRAAAPPHHHATTSVSPASAPHAWCIRRSAVVLEPKTLPLAGRHRVAGERATTLSHAWAARDDHVAARPARAHRTGRLHGWTGAPGRGPAGLPANHTWQAVGSRPIAAGRFRPNTVRWILNHFQLFLISKIVSNFQNW